jgi:hypothetical protein
MHQVHTLSIFVLAWARFRAMQGFFPMSLPGRGSQAPGSPSTPEAMSI